MSHRARPAEQLKQKSQDGMTCNARPVVALITCTIYRINNMNNLNDKYIINDIGSIVPLGASSKSWCTRAWATAKDQGCQALKI